MCIRDSSQVGPFSEADRQCASLRNGSVACRALGTWTGRPTDGSGFGHQDHWYVPPHNLTAGGVQSDHWKACAVLSNGDIECWGFNGGPNNPGWDGGWLGLDYYCHGENDPNGCDSANFVLSPRRIVLPRPLMVQEMDLDGDGISKLLDGCEDGESGWTSNSSTDFDGDGCRDATEDDDDNGDGIPDPLDSDCDGIGDEADPDDDNDGIPDETDTFPYNPYEWSDIDDDGTGDNCDCDTDGDGINNDIDAFPTDPSAHTDTDGDGMPDTMSIPDLNSIPSNGLIGYWDFDDASGNPVDSSNEAHISSTHGDPSYGEAGHAGTAIQFDGAGDYIEIDADDAFNMSHITISAWLKLGYLFLGDGPYSMYSSGLVCRGTDSGPAGSTAEAAWCIDLYPHSNDNGTHLRFFFHQIGQPWTYIQVATTTSLDLSWNHVVATFDGNTAKIYLNGQLEATSTSVNSSLLSSNEPVYVATRQAAQGNGVFNFFDASIDEVRIYNRALSQSEITILHQVSYTLIEDLDDDNDGTLDTDDAFPLDPSEDTDTDGDGVGDNADDDADGDGYSDLMDPFPLDSTEWSDTDFDGLGDNTDTDDDNDGTLDTDDAFPLDPSEDTDTDGDGVGDNADDDADGDGEVDNETPQSIGPLNPSNSLKLSLLINFFLILLATLVISSRRSSSGLNLVEFEKMPEPQITTAVKGRKEVLEKYLSQGYSPELANTLADNEIRKS